MVINHKKSLAIRISAGLALILSALVMQPAISQETVASDSLHELAIRDFLRLAVSPRLLERVYSGGASQASLQFQRLIQPRIGRSFTESEKQRLYAFWYRKLREIITPEKLEQILVPVYAKYFTLEEIQAINQFYRTPAGEKLLQLSSSSALTRNTENATAELRQEFQLNEELRNSFVEELRDEFPSWFPEQ